MIVFKSNHNKIIHFGAKRLKTHHVEGLSIV